MNPPLQQPARAVALQSNWFNGSLIRLFDRLLLIFIAIQGLQNVTVTLRDQLGQIELVLLTAVAAVPPGLIAVGLAGAGKANPASVPRQAEP